MRNALEQLVLQMTLQYMALLNKNMMKITHLMLVARQHGLVFNLDKCHIKDTKITFFGMLLDAEGVHPDPENVKAIRAIQELQDTQELQTFLHIATYMAPFIPNLSATSEPLRNLLKKDIDFQ